MYIIKLLLAVCWYQHMRKMFAIMIKIFFHCSGLIFMFSKVICWLTFFSFGLILVVLWYLWKSVSVVLKLKDIRNTVGNIPMEWFKDYSHIGYDLLGRKILKPEAGDEIDEFIEKNDNPDYWCVFVTISMHWRSSLLVPVVSNVLLIYLSVTISGDLSSR